MLLRICFIIVFICLIWGTLALAQESSDEAILFIWNDTLIAQGISKNELLETSATAITKLQGLPRSDFSVYSFEDSPLVEPPTDGYGFYQGLWSLDKSKFVYLEIDANSPNYRVILLENELQTILLSSQVHRNHGYLVPVAWTQNGDLALIERHMLHNLREVRLWHYDFATTETTFLGVIAIPHLRGNSISLADGWVFIGFDTIGLQGYLLNVNGGQIATFNTSFALQDPPASVFELYPIAVLGVVNLSEFKAQLEQNSTEEIQQKPISFTPFLHWPLPDDARSITCYPDSEWTDKHFDVECVGLQTARSYQGHEGTDIGGKPNGLAIGTPVYAAARGIVVDTFSGCASGDASCGESYGNTVLMEHTRMNNHNIETWFTGYAHLQNVLVQPYDYIEELGVPIALSGGTGLGGAHLHFEVRSLEQGIATNWINPWDDSFGELWIGGNDAPISAVVAYPPPTLFTCQSDAGNNIRSGAGVNYDVLSKTTIGTNYEVFQVQYVNSNQAPGDWYHIRWEGNTGWIWSGLMDCIAIGG